MLRITTSGRWVCYKIVGLLVLLACAGAAYAAPRRIYGVVRNAEGQPVVRCVVRPSNKAQPVLTDTDGHFMLQVDRGVEALTFQSMGYETKTVAIKRDTIRVILDHKIMQLEDVVVATGKNKYYRQGILGKDKLKPFGICTGETGDEWAIFLDADSAKHGVLDQIFIYILRDGIPNARFQVHVYDIDTPGIPGRDLLDTILIAHANTGNEWVKVDVSSMQVPVGMGIFISVEWVAGYNNNMQLVMSRKYPAQPPFNGQVVAFTEGYHKRGSLMFRRNALEDTAWEYMILGGETKKSVLNAMVYATYHYIREH